MVHPPARAAAVPYERLQARCGELVQFRWNDPRSEEGQTVALLNATSSEDALGALLVVVGQAPLALWQPFACQRLPCQGLSP